MINEILFDDEDDLELLLLDSDLEISSYCEAKAMGKKVTIKIEEEKVDIEKERKFIKVNKTLEDLNKLQKDYDAIDKEYQNSLESKCEIEKEISEIKNKISKLKKEVLKCGHKKIVCIKGNELSNIETAGALSYIKEDIRLKRLYDNLEYGEPYSVTIVTDDTEEAINIKKEIEELEMKKEECKLIRKRFLNVSDTLFKTKLPIKRRIEILKHRLLMNDIEWGYKDEETGELLSEKEYRDYKMVIQRRKKYITSKESYKQSPYDIYPFEIDFSQILKEAFDPVQGTGIIRGYKL